MNGRPEGGKGEVGGLQHGGFMDAVLCLVSWWCLFKVVSIDLCTEMDAFVFCNYSTCLSV